MDQHPIPRQITTFEFKLIGFMTLKQFLYLVIFVPLGYIVFRIIPFPFLNALMGVLIATVGVAFAFIPIQDRPMEVWIRNFMKRLNSPTQYRYHKKNNPVGFLNDIYFAGDPHMTMTHVDTKEKLNAYLAAQKKEQSDPVGTKRAKQQMHVTDLLEQTKNTNPHTIKKSQGSIPEAQKAPKEQSVVKQPFVTGIVKNRRNIALPGILVSIKSPEGEQLRLLKTNPHGIFATYSPLTPGEYLFEASDPNGNYFFDTMNVAITTQQQNPILLFSKEIL